MAIGDSYNYNGNHGTDNNKKEYKSPEIFSGYNTSNENGVDATALNYSFWKGFLKISVAPMLKNPTEKQKWDHKNAASVYLNRQKARVLRYEAEKVLEGKQENGGVNSGESGVISFSNGKEVGINGYCLIIRNVSSDGVVNATYIYEFCRERYYGVSDFKAENSNFNKVFYDTIEVDEFMQMLDEFVKHMTKAVAYTVMEEIKFNVSRVNTKLGLIGEALGVEFNGGDGSKRERGASYFDSGSSNDSSSSSRSSARSSTIDDIGMNPPE